MGSLAPRSLALAVALAATCPAAGATDFGRQNYLLHCSGCHLPDGSGSAPNEVPTLHGIPGHFASIPEGRAFLTQVPGIAYSSLSDAEVAEILNWSLWEFSRDTLPPDFRPFTPEEVTRLRAVRPAAIFKVRAEVLELLRQRGVTVEY
jgi:mono/diheme cytochrome c family protein